MEGVLNLNEAFKAFDIIEEDAFSVDKKGIEELNDYLKDDNIEQDVDLSVFDVDAENEGELKDSYVGDVILNCSICNAKLFKNPEDVVIDDEAQLANIGETCPYCQSSNGYTIIGQVKPYEEVETHIEIEDKVEESLGSDLNKYQKWVDYDMKRYGKVSDKTNRELKKAGLELVKDDHGDYEVITNSKMNEKCGRRKSMKEDIESINIETEDQTINVSTKKKDTIDQEVVGTLDMDTISKFKDSDEEYVDIDIDEFDEESFDDLQEKYLKKVYENVRSYETVKASTIDNLIKLEGIITFKSGNKAKTNFIFESKSINNRNKVRFIGENKQFARGKKTYQLEGRIRNNKFIAESLTYNYRAKDGRNGKIKTVYGKIR